MAFVFLFILTFVLTLFVWYKPRLRKFYIFFKSTTSFLCLLIAFWGLFRGGEKSYVIPIMSALCFCLLGDIFLALDTNKKKKRIIVLGSCAFFVGHILFALFFFNLAPISFLDIFLPIISFLGCFYITGKKNCSIGSLRFGALIYSLAVSLTCSRGLSLLLYHGFELKYILVALGTLLFFMSDISIIFIYFFKNKRFLLKVFNLLTYFIGIALIGFSTWT